jgi:hypothetical protein
MLFLAFHKTGFSYRVINAFTTLPSRIMQHIDFKPINGGQHAS